MLILGIETSCDETSAAVVENGTLVRSNVVSSQIALHAPYGGVVPEIASRQHIRGIAPVVEMALREARVELSDIEAIAATRGPGLAGALLVGINFARGLALARKVPLIPVNHLEGHIHSVWLRSEHNVTGSPELPLLSLIVSGGHTELVVMRRHGEYELIGRTRDDAAGEAFDKVARLIGQPYPGGPAIQKLSQHATHPHPLPRAWLPGTYDFSFSGLKTAVLHTVYEAIEGQSPGQVRGRALPRVDVVGGLPRDVAANIAAGFQESVVDVLVRKTVAAAEEHNVASVALVGGVAANSALREAMQADVQRPLFIAPLEYATDNAAMIAAAAYFVPKPPEDLDIDPALELATA
ncbi:MAG: tRNA (adenosine(37)-N6)-threonylcarbamoyltransferase complex transferase subunit TsaD [Chloroflexota bacterium]